MRALDSVDVAVVDAMRDVPLPDDQTACQFSEARDLPRGSVSLDRRLSSGVGSSESK